MIFIAIALFSGAIKFQHRTENYEWTNYCYLQLKNKIPLNPPVYKKSMDPRLQKGYSESYYVQSKTDETITELYNIWYPHGQKQLPFHYIAQHLDEEALSWWYQDDGHLKITKGNVTKIVLSTDDFSTEENKQLIEILYKKFKIRFQFDG